MLLYVLKRILFFIPKFFLITIIAFFITSSSPIDPVQKYAIGLNQDARSIEIAQKEYYAKYGLDKPLFYFSINNYASCDTLNRVPLKQERETLHYLSQYYGNWDKTSSYYLTIKNELKQDNSGNSISILKELLLEKKEDRIDFLIQKLEHKDAILANFNSLKESKTITNKLIPTFNWYGANSQYHEWIFRFLKGDFGNSYVTGEPVARVLGKKLWRSFELVFFAILIAYFISIPIGVFMSKIKSKTLYNGVNLSLVLLMSIPSFIFGIFLMHYFSNPEHLFWFESNGYKDFELSEDAYYKLNYLERLWHSLPYMVLPIITYIYASFAFLAKQTEVSLLEENNKLYVLAAKAKGVTDVQLTWKHTLKNALFPLITLFANIFPLAIGSSVVVEYVFQYNGIGKATVEAIQVSDRPILLAVICLSALMVMVSHLVTDILYQILDPRIKLK